MDEPAQRASAPRRRFSITAVTLVLIVIAGFGLASYTYRAATDAINAGLAEFQLRQECYTFIDSVTRQDATLYDLIVTHDLGTRDEYYALDAQIRPQLPALAKRLRDTNLEGAPVLADDIDNVYPLWRDSIARPVAEHPTSKASVDTLDQGQMYVTTFADDIGRVQREIDDRLDGRIATLRHSVFTALLLNGVFAVVFGAISLLVDARRRKAERARADEMERKAMYDVLTKLPNRALFADRFQQWLLHSQRYQNSLGLLFVDLDCFKPVNDRLGHDAGDEVLKAISERLLECVRKTDTVSRQGGDEFVILLTMISDAQEAARVAQRIVERCAVPMRVRGESVTVGASVGIALSPQDAGDMELLIKLADEAMLTAKRSGKGCWRFAGASYAQLRPSDVTDQPALGAVGM